MVPTVERGRGSSPEAHSMPAAPGAWAIIRGEGRWPLPPPKASRELRSATSPLSSRVGYPHRSLRHVLLYPLLSCTLRIPAVDWPILATNWVRPDSFGSTFIPLRDGVSCCQDAVVERGGERVTDGYGFRHGEEKASTT
jgi:hypothetical protein